VSIKRTSQELGEKTSPKRRALVSAQLSQPKAGDKAGHAMATAVHVDRGDEDEGADEGTGGAYPESKDEGTGGGYPPSDGGKDDELQEGKDQLDAGEEDAEQDNADQENAEEGRGPIEPAYRAFESSFAR